MKIVITTKQAVKFLRKDLRFNQTWLRAARGYLCARWLHIRLKNQVLGELKVPDKLTPSSIAKHGLNLLSGTKSGLESCVTNLESSRSVFDRWLAAGVKSNTIPQIEHRINMTHRKVNTLLMKNELGG